MKKLKCEVCGRPCRPGFRWPINSELMCGKCARVGLDLGHNIQWGIVPHAHAVLPFTPRSERELANFRMPEIAGLQSDKIVRMRELNESGSISDATWQKLLQQHPIQPA